MKKFFSTLMVLLSLQFTVSHELNAMSSETQNTINNFSESTHLKALFRDSYGYAVFTDVAEGGIGLSGAYGEGEVFRGGEKVGTATLTHVAIGASLGGKTFDQVIFFQDQRAFDEFTSGKFAFSADASAIAFKAGAQATTSTVGNTASTDNANQHGEFVDGIAVYQYAKGGLMLDLSIGGQEFSYKPN